MQIDISKEITELQIARENLNKALTKFFLGKWVLALDYKGCKFTNTNPVIARNKDNNIISFKVDKCRPKAVALASDYIVDELVLEGTDKFGKPRTRTISRSGITHLRWSTNKDQVNRNIFDYDIAVFETSEEAELYAELQEQLSPNEK